MCVPLCVCVCVCVRARARVHTRAAMMLDDCLWAYMLASVCEHAFLRLFGVSVL